MIEPMNEKTEHTLACMPWPARVETVAGSAGTKACAEATTFKFLAVDDPRVRQYAERVLGAYTLGPVKIDIASSEAEAMPSVGMDESYRLSIDEGVISLSSNAVWGALRGLATLAQLARHDHLFVGLSIDDFRALPGAGCCSVARHFSPCSHAVIDGLAALK